MKKKLDKYSYNLSVTTLKLIELIERSFLLEISFEDSLFIQEIVEDYCLEECPNGICAFLNTILSGKEDGNKVPLPTRFNDIQNVLLELEDRFKLNICEYGEWLLWHLPGLGYALYIQREANPMYYFTSQKLLSLSYDEAIKNY